MALSSTETDIEPAPHDRFSLRGLFAAIFSLALGGVFVGTGEFASMSLLPGMAEATNVSIPTAGVYISAYAVGVVIGAPLFAVLGARWSRKTLLLALLGLFVIGYVASAAASGFASMLASRFVAGLPHGAYYGVAALIAAEMVPEHRRARAVGWVMLGLAGANLLGVPAATWLGQELSWEAAFVGVAFGGVLIVLMVAAFVPAVPAAADSSARQELSGLRNAQMWLTLAVASIGFGGMFAVYTYITPTLTQVTGIAEQSVPWVLMLWGAGMVLGNLLGGSLADRGLTRAILAILVWNAVFLGLFSLTAGTTVGALTTLFLIGAGFALVPALQTRLMRVAGPAQTLAAALNHSAFNVSNSLGAGAGGAGISVGLGWAATGWIGALFAVAGIVLMVVAVAHARQNTG